MMRKEKYQQRSKFDKSNKCGRCGWSPAHPKEECPAREAVCRKCSKRGHYQRACHTPTTVNAVDDTLFFGVVQDENDPSPWVIKLKLNGADHTFKIDTGADVTVISMETARHLVLN